MVLLVRVRGVLHKGGEGKGYLSTVFFLSFFLVMCFAVSDVFWFYVFYEATLVPTRILILGWGDQPERLEAARYIICYTVMCSAPLFFAFMWLGWGEGRFFIWFIGYKRVLSRWL